MAQQTINIGAAPNDGTGDNPRTAFDKANDNFTELYVAVATLQPLDGDLTSLAAASGTNTIYYRSAADTWSPVVVSTGLAFSSGNLTASGGDVFLAGSNPFTGALNTFMGADVVFGHTAALDTAARVEVNGTTDATAGLSLARWSADTLSAVVNFRKSRGTTPGTVGLVSAGDLIGALDFYANNGAAFNRGVRITASADASLFSANVPGRLSFWTVGPTSGDGEQERVRIDSAGALTVGLTTQYAKFGPAGGIIKSVTDGSNAAAGYVGEYVESAASGSVSIPAGGYTAVQSLNLSAGDWDVAAAIQGGAGNFAAGGEYYVTIHTAAAAPGAALGGTVHGRATADGDAYTKITSLRFNLSAPATLYVNIYAVNACFCRGQLYARRMR